jgi:hypothetical protein
MKKLFVALALIFSLTAYSRAATVCSGYLNSTTDVCRKIDQLKDVIFHTYAKSGVLLYAPFYYWTCKDNKNLIYYCYGFVPLGASDEALIDKVHDAVEASKVNPIYVQIRIDGAGRMTS